MSDSESDSDSSSDEENDPEPPLGNFIEHSKWEERQREHEMEKERKVFPASSLSLLSTMLTV